MSSACQKFVLYHYFAALFLLWSSLSAAHAQNVPASADLSRIAQPLEESKTVIPQMSPPETQGQYTALEPPEGAGQYQFELKKIIIEGGSVYAQAELSELYQARINTKVSVAEIFEIANAITRKYRDDGYILAQTFVPPQEIDGGTVRISITEGMVNRIYPQGLDDKSANLIQDIMDQVAEKTAFNIHSLEKRLLLLNRMTGYNAYSVLEPSKSGVQGAIDIKIVFEPRENIFRVGADNYGSRFVGPWQGSVSAAIPHHKYLHGETRVAIYTTPNINELKFLSLSNISLLNSKGLTMESALSLSRSEPGEALADVDLASRYLSLRLKFEQPLLLSRRKQLQLFGAFEYTNSSSDVLAARFFDDRLRAVRVGVNGYITQVLNGSLQGRAALSQGLDIMGARQTGSADLSRERGRSDFTKLDAQLTYRTGMLKNFGLNTSLFGQYSATPLLSSEEFGYGGYSAGRAYNNSEITGDSGLSALLELSYNKWNDYNGSAAIPGIAPFIFYDIGKVWNRDPDSKPQSGASAGLGVQINWAQHGTARATLAQPLTRSVANPVRGNGKNTRFMLSISKQF